MNNKFCFPAIGITNDSIISFRSLDELSQCTLKALNNGYYENLLLVDINGQSALVESIIKPRELVKKLIGIIGGKITVELKLCHRNLITLSELKTMCIEQVNNDQEFWESAGPIDDIVSVINGFKTFDDIVDFFY